jgi:nucleotide-binding universal stress UspA family protein
MNMKKVLIAMDYDPTAQRVAEKGFKLAKSMNAQVTLLHVIADETYYSSLEYSPILGFDGFSNAQFFQVINIDGLKKASLYYLDNMKLHLGDSSIQVLVEEGKLADAILKTANKIQADVIVMGSHSRKWLEKIVMGSVTEEVLNHTQIPLFIIPTRKR